MNGEKQVSFSPSGHTFASGSCDKRIKIWDARSLASRECLNTFDDQADQVWGIAYSPDGQQLAAVAEDGAVSVYEIQRSM
jgi:WD40 repeat protein